MWFNILFLTVTFWDYGLTDAQSFSVPGVKVFNYANSDDSKRIFYTNLTEISVFEDFDPADYPNSKDLGIGMLGELPMNCSCPDLRPIHSVATNRGQLKFERAEMITEDMTDYGLAGYLAPFPGYCGSDQVEVIEFFSRVLGEYRYDTSNNIYNYYSDYKNEFRPVRVIGYAYYSTGNVWLSGTPPFIKQGLQSPAYKSISVQFQMVRVLTKNGSTSYAITPELIDNLVQTKGWTLTNTVLPGTVNAQNELDKIREICGANFLSRCRDTLDPATGLYRPVNSDVQGVGNKTEYGDCGYWLSPTSTCFPQATQFYSYIPNYANNTVIYGNYNDGGSGNSVGLAYPYIFAFLKL
uniref:Secreted protein n=1 Tax=Caenorhabditis tropicalis TaxID=1561998 RepID=A0A1I7T7K4_9PELO